MARFFIERPVFAWVIAILIMLLGILALRGLPVEQYPKVAPPTVTISATYPGASARSVQSSVTQLIEQSLTGIDYLRYFSSSSSDGSASITLTFEPEADPDTAQVQTQNKIQSAIAQLPAEVQALGVNVTKANSSYLMVIGVYSEDGSLTQTDIGDLANRLIREPVSRINGVGNVNFFGSQYAMRIWLDPQKLNSYSLTPVDVENAIRAQNIDVSAGQIGGMPAAANQQINATFTAQSRLKTVEQFERIIIRVNEDGSQLHLADVARVERGAEAYDVLVRYKRKPAVGMGVSLATGANALESSKLIKQKVAEIAKTLPPGVKVVYPRDATPFIQLSIESVVKTLIEAVVLVFFVMLLFLQNLRATLIPTIAVPVVLLGTFAVLSALGYSINVLTMFAMVLAIGLLVDDAIVVVENVERIMHEEHLPAKQATIKSMSQITSALIGIAIVLSTVFVPMAFFSGAAGVIYRQFSITIITAMTLSVLVAMILSPSLCASFLKPQNKTGLHSMRFFRGFNFYFDKIRQKYQNATHYMIRRTLRFIGIYALLVAGMAYLFNDLPESFIPNEDQGIMYMTLKTPDNATANRTLESAKQIEDYFLEEQGDLVEHLFAVVGFSFAGSAQNAGIGFVGLKDWSERTQDDQSVFAINDRARQALSDIKDASVFTFFPPPIRELGNSSGFNFQLVDANGQGHQDLMQAVYQLLELAATNHKLVGVRQNGLSDVPQFQLNIDSEKASALGIPLTDINQTLQIAWGGKYVNNYLDRGRLKRVYLQADIDFRMMPDNVTDWYVRNQQGQMVSFDAFSTPEWQMGSPKLERFNGNPSINFLGAPAAGVSSGEAMAEIEQLVTQLDGEYRVEWYGISYEEKQTGSQAVILYLLSILMVFLSLAALYESWRVPFSVILIIPLGILGAITAAWLFNLSNDVYLQVALLTTVGLAAKNAILIVEFAKSQVESGQHKLSEAIGLAAKQRFRPIIMTSLAFTMGVLPLALSSGAGAASQNAIGISVIGGMVTATGLTILFVPLFYTLIERRVAKKAGK
ncbi:efflux RND transporter permease subunit [Catenovulum sp. 2E275]|uniref:efflux RND transporter permease subunit n=1 Tax=Catenovulum sp. 2E275 TaxID=2980497 RepID=UPI0021CE567D|nr:efflux RND transporter permease subunit [Catenovulum sp. 2E275]MCU4674088.1 efflux RND transporter permease subunit [Catenovulum sp. 2E275]